MRMLGHDSLHLLKMDIKGSEYEVFEDMLSDLSAPPPEQISFELHAKTHTPVTWQKRMITPGEIGMLSARLYLAGYRVMSREPNTQCPHCIEYTVAGFLCNSL